MKKNCNGCRALEQRSSTLEHFCTLRHPIECTKELYGIPVTYRPLEDCEKPTTFKKLVEVCKEKGPLSSAMRRRVE